MAHVQIPPPELVPFGMRALKCVAMADGSFAEPERALLEAAQQLFRVSVDLDALAPITPAELAGAVEDPALRLQLVRAMLMVSLVDGEASPAEAAQVRAFADGELDELKANYPEIRAAQREHPVGAARRSAFALLLDAVVGVIERRLMTWQPRAAETERT